MSGLARAAVIGHPIAHSMSPAIFAEFSRISGIGIDYRALDVAPEGLAASVMALRNDARFVGYNVTMPHKQTIMSAVDRCSPVALACNAVNVVRREGDALVGDNTDVDGIEAALRELAFDPADCRAVVFGSGGAAAAALAVLAARGAAHITIATRSPAIGSLLARSSQARYRATSCAVTSLGSALDVADLYVNATPIGMHGVAPHELLPANAPPRACVFDMVYRPAPTPLVMRAQARGMRAVGGLTMLLEQARATFERWFATALTLDDDSRARLAKAAG